MPAIRGSISDFQSVPVNRSKHSCTVRAPRAAGDTCKPKAAVWAGSDSDVGRITFAESIASVGESWGKRIAFLVARFVADGLDAHQDYYPTEAGWFRGRGAVGQWHLGDLCGR